MSTEIATTTPTYDEGHLGPAMEALPPRMRQYVFAVIQTGCSQAKAAELAGYAGGPATWKSKGWLLAHDSRVQAAMHEEAQKLIRSTAVMAINVIAEIASDRKGDAKDRLKAAVELLNRSGLHAHTEHKIVVDRPLSGDEEIARVRKFCAELGLDAAQLLGRAGVVVDAEFEVVSPAYSTAGLEDLLGLAPAEPEDADNA
jgi:hypothetical protein